MKRAKLLIAVLVCGVAATAQAGSFDSGPGYRPAVPISAFARPADWLDLSRLNVSAEFIMGGGGRGVDGLQVTRLQYQIANPLAVRVSLGNTFGARAAGGNGMFLEGLDLSYQPFRSFLIQVRYQDVRTPLQYSRTSPYDLWR